VAKTERYARLFLPGLPSAFTLIELLVVISIISVMMSVLLPFLTSAQKHAKSVHCLANQRQLTFGWITYATDHEHMLCDPDEFTSQLRPYVANVTDVFLCKSLGMEIGVASYGLSNTMGGKSRDNVKPFAGLQHVSNSSNMLVLVDIEPKAKRCFWPLAWNEDHWQWRPWSWPPSESLQGMTARHRNGCNMSFADGNGEYNRWKDNRTLDMIKGNIGDPNDASEDNSDLDKMIARLVYSK